MMNEYELDENELKEAINEFNEKRNPSQKDSVKKPSKKNLVKAARRFKIPTDGNSKAESRSR